jgi:mRNA interferase MazF
MTRGELWWIDYGVPFGSEPGYKRPVLVIQNDLFNNSKINTTVVIPLTTNLLLADVPGNIFLDKKESKLPKDSVILLSQIGVVDKQRFVEKISKTSKDTMKKIENSMMFILGIKML